MSTSQDLFVENLSLLVFPLFEKAGCLKNKEVKGDFSVEPNGLTGSDFASLAVHKFSPSSVRQCGHK